MQELVSYKKESASKFQNAASALGGNNKPILKFDKGDWLLGQEAVAIPNGTKLAANIAETTWGWLRWVAKTPVERRMVLVDGDVNPAARDTLGHTDEALWEKDDDGHEQDPWQFTVEIPARQMEGEMKEVVIAGSSKGFRGCCNSLFAAFGKGMIANDGMIPVITLGTDRYKHTKHGWVKVPTLLLGEWVDPRELAEAQPDLLENGSAEPEAPETGVKKSKTKF